MTKRNLRSKPSTVGEDAELLFQKKIRDLESLNESLKLDVEELKSKLAGVSVTSSSSGGTLQSSRASNKSIAIKEEGMSSRSKSNPRSIKKPGTESCVKQVDGEVQKLKAQKVKLQCKIKLDSMQFRLSKASLEKETLQLKKELRKSEFEKHVLSALNRRQKQILQLKNTQALTALKRLKLLLQPKKTFSKKNNGLPKGTSSTIQAGESSNEVVLLVKLNKIHSGYERQMKEIAEEVKKFSLEASVLKAEFEGEQNSFSPSCDNGVNQTPIDSELKELKEEFSKLSTLVSQMEMAKPQFSQTDRVQTGPVEYSVPSKDKDESNLILSQERTSVYGTESRSIEPSEVKESGETLSSEEAHCKKEQSKAEMCCSCTKKSLCKTKSCKCRANGSGCGISCGCIASKCSNRGENVRSDKAMQAVVDGIGKKPVDDTKVANKQPLRDIGNIQEAGKVGKLKKVQKPVAKK
ncbi:kinesin-like protein KIN-4C isoform X2 [Raphanus sativus]|uniref:Kinesin-like protein KIN-4C isoform X2 n=1 Tax=Raphanus sativus TaxID=3726 RepID=A0A9W3C7Y0_RAPSA|nr:kinesin-like protein KIN-4C isoform X2 [Raphanus sativus]